MCRDHCCLSCQYVNIYCRRKWNRPLCPNVCRSGRALDTVGCSNQYVYIYVCGGRRVLGNYAVYTGLYITCTSINTSKSNFYLLGIIPRPVEVTQSAETYFSVLNICFHLTAELRVLHLVLAYKQPKHTKAPHAIPNTTTCWLASKQTALLTLLLEVLGTLDDPQTIICAPCPRGCKRDPTLIFSPHALETREIPPGIAASTFSWHRLYYWHVGPGNHFFFSPAYTLRTAMNPAI